MEDAATAEISRSQIWQWIHAESKLPDGTIISRPLVEQIVAEETTKLMAEIGGDVRRGRRVQQARVLFEEVALGPDFPTFLTIPAYAWHV
jgi:malate synthase